MYTPEVATQPAVFTTAIKKQSQTLFKLAILINDHTLRHHGSSRKAASDRNPHMRSDSKKCNAKKRRKPQLFTKTINNNTVNLAVMNLSSP